MHRAGCAWLITRKVGHRAERQHPRNCCRRWRSELQLRGRRGWSAGIAVRPRLSRLRLNIAAARTAAALRTRITRIPLLVIQASARAASPSSAASARTRRAASRTSSTRALPARTDHSMGRAATEATELATRPTRVEEECVRSLDSKLTWQRAAVARAQALVEPACVSLMHRCADVPQGFFGGAVRLTAALSSLMCEGRRRRQLRQRLRVFALGPAGRPRPRPVVRRGRLELTDAAASSSPSRPAASSPASPTRAASSVIRAR